MKGLTRKATGWDVIAISLEDHGVFEVISIENFDNLVGQA